MRRRGRSTVTFQYPKASFGKIFDCSVSSKARTVSQMRVMSSSDSSQLFFLPRFLRSGLNHGVASMSWTFPCAMGGFPVAEHPDVGGNAGVVEHVQRQGDNGFQPVVLDDPAADVALALPGVPGEERAAVVHLGNAAAKLRALLHLAQHVSQKQHLTIAGTGDQQVLGVVRVLDQEAGVAHVLFAAHALQVALPALSVGRMRA